jgi:hypothetical protein
MAATLARLPRLAIHLLLPALVIGVLAFGLSGRHRLRAASDASAPDDEGRQVTVFGVVATPGRHTPDSNLARIHGQLVKLLPGHEFRLIDVQNKRLMTGESVTCALGGNNKIVTSVVQSVDDDGKVALRCEFYRGEVRQASTLVKTPLHQLFFCQRTLDDGTRLLIGVGAR